MGFSDVIKVIKIDGQWTAYCNNPGIQVTAKTRNEAIRKMWARLKIWNATHVVSKN